MKEMKIITLISLYILLSSIVYSQDTRKIEKNNNIDLTVGGNGLFVSLNYSRILLIETKYFINVSVGVGTVPFIGGITMPHQITINIGRKNNFLEFGIGASYWSGKSNASAYTETLTQLVNNPVTCIFITPCKSSIIKNSLFFFKI